MRVGIFFGGKSKEREISFAGGRTVYDNINKSLFTPVPVFVDSFGNFCLLNWQNIYKGSIRDFYPSISSDHTDDFLFYSESLGEMDINEQKQLLLSIGKPIEKEKLNELIDFAFLALHGKFGEDGTIQAILEDLQIPYSGSGILACAIGIDKVFQRKMMFNSKFNCPPFLTIERYNWLNDSKEQKQNFFEKAEKEIGFPLVIRPATQGSSIGVKKVSIPDIELFNEAIEESFFIQTIEASIWNILDDIAQQSYIEKLIDFRTGIGLPVKLDDKIIYHPLNLLKEITKKLSKSKSLKLYALDNENKVLLEPFIDGREFSCIVVKHNNDKAIALPPTEIIKGKEIFDYRSKYLPGLARKNTPIDLDEETIIKIQKECVELFDFFQFNVYARIDGFLKNDGSIILNDPNTTSGMLPSSFFFHQAAEIGINPSQFLTYIICQSVFERMQSNAYDQKYKLQTLFHRLNHQLENSKLKAEAKIKIAIIFGGYSSERHISVESGRNIYEKLNSSAKYDPVPVFLTKINNELKFYKIPVNILLKDNADDIKDKIIHYKPDKIVQKVVSESSSIIEKYTFTKTSNYPEEINLTELSKLVDGSFIALHGRPGEDGELQRLLAEHNISYNGSSPDTSMITINKYNTNQYLSDFDFLIPDQFLVFKHNWIENENATIDFLESKVDYPYIAKPVDDGCSAAVKKINDQEELKAFAKLIFREGDEDLNKEAASVLNLKFNEEFPFKDQFLVESLIKQTSKVKRFLEITVGILTEILEGGGIFTTVFEPSEVVSKDSILSLEEKFLAGEGQNITPARFDYQKSLNEQFSQQVKAEIKRLSETLGIEGYARIDAFVKIYADNSIETIILEVNSLPGMTPATCIFHQAAISGYKPYDFIDKILDYSFKKKRIGQDI